eukprot:15393965-Alexandrium_andersonii.AAC.1
MRHVQAQALEGAFLWETSEQCCQCASPKHIFTCVSTPRSSWAQHAARPDERVSDEGTRAGRRLALFTPIPQNLEASA